MVKKVNSQEFENEVVKAPVAVVDFSATWCGPCRMLAPVLEEISEKLGDKVSFYAVDVDESAGLAMMFNVNSVPCLVLLKNGKPVSQSVGFRPEPQLTAWIEGNL
jgi:thioredoxin 1